jgi:multiple sugar transport system ATP-binding protein
MNLGEASIEDDAVVFGGFRLPLDAARRPAADVRRVVLGIRPETFEDASLAAAALPRVTVDVEVVEELGAETIAFFRIDAARVAADTAAPDDAGEGLITGETQLFTARLDPRSRVRGAGRVDLAVDPSRFHFFDPTTSVALPLRDAARAEIAPIPA